MVEKFKEKFRALIEDYKVTKNDNEDFCLVVCATSSPI